MLLGGRREKWRQDLCLKSSGGLTARVVAGPVEPAATTRLAPPFPDTRFWINAMPAILKRFATVAILLTITMVLLTLSGGA